jgi:hypothetical protein
VSQQRNAHQAEEPDSQPGRYDPVLRPEPAVTDFAHLYQAVAPIVGDEAAVAAAAAANRINPMTTTAGLLPPSRDGQT